MPRNAERDAQEMIRRKEQLIKAGFKLFADKGIESVSLQTVADEAAVGVATLYNYYTNKTNLLIAISAYIWGNVWKEAMQHYGGANDNKNAYQWIEFYTDVIIGIYNNRPDILRFSGDYKTYICRESVTDDKLVAHLDALEPIGRLFHDKYEDAKIDGSIRTDIPEEEMFSTISLTMLGMAERYAKGLVWTSKGDQNYNRQLQYTKEMLLGWVSNK